jgi:hypothetical protein
MQVAIILTTTDRIFTETVMPCMEVVEVVMADADPSLQEHAQLSATPSKAKAIHLQWIELGSQLAFRWAIYATLNLVDDPAMLAIVFT